jgi:hypothetical protein
MMRFYAKHAVNFALVRYTFARNVSSSCTNHVQTAKLPEELPNSLHPHPIALHQISRFHCNAFAHFRCYKCNINLDLGEIATTIHCYSWRNCLPIALVAANLENAARTRPMAASHVTFLCIHRVWRISRKIFSIHFIHTTLSRSHPAPA